MDKPQQFINPVFSTLLNHLQIEQEIALSKKNVFDALFPLLCDDFTSSSIAKPYLIETVKQYNIEEVNGSNIQLFTLLIYLDRKYSLGLRSDKKREIFAYVEQAAEKKYLILSRKALIAFLINEAGFQGKITKLNRYLAEISNSFLDEGKIEKAVEAGYGLPADALDRFNDIEIQKLAQIASSSRLGKMVILLVKVNPGISMYVVDKLERRLHNNYSDWIKPDFWIAIIESEKIVNSNLSQQEVSNVFTALKEASPGSFRIIEKVSNEGIYVQLGQMVSTPSFSPIEDTFALLAIAKSGRKTTVQISTDEFEKYNLSRSKSGKIEPNAVLVLTFTMIILSALSFFWAGWLFHLYGFRGMLGTVLAQELSGNTIGDYFSILISPIAQIALTFWWMVNVYRFVIRTGTLSVLTVFKNFPFIKSFLDKIAKP